MNSILKMSVVFSFPPVADDRARVLVLGSMPGLRSLQAGEYYAHPQNAFWPLMGALFGAGRDLPYPQRLARLQSRGIALWDVLESCERPGSLDADIVESSLRTNDLIGFLRRHPGIRRIYFNGAKAEACFRRHVRLPADLGLPRQRLPSTSPAHATLDFAAKLAAWSVIGTAAD